MAPYSNFFSLAPLALHALVVVHVLSSPMAEILHFMLRNGYPVLVAWVFLEQVGLPLPSSPLLFVAGALAGTGKMSFTETMGLVMIAAMTADAAWFLWGRWRGAGVLRVVCRISLEPDTCVRRTKEAVARHGRWAILAAKFVPGLNAAAAPLAGVTGMSLAEYLALDACSSFLWAGAFMGLGRIFSRQLDQLADYVRGFGGALFGLLAILLAIYIVRKYQARRRLLRGIWTERIEPAELRDLMEEGGSPAIVDLRHDMDFRVHPFVIPGATHFDPKDLDHRHQEIPRDREIILYCT
jgi:membrane protein DedA with SNARE-associated domain